MSRLGLKKGARNPASISNIEFHDPSGSQKVSAGIPGTINFVVATSTALTILEPQAILWVVNTDTAVHYLFAGPTTDVPATVTASNGMAIPAGEGVLIHCGESDVDGVSMAVRTSSATLHVTVLEA